MHGPRGYSGLWKALGCTSIVHCLGKNIGDIQNPILTLWKVEQALEQFKSGENAKDKNNHAEGGKSQGPKCGKNQFDQKWATTAQLYTHSTEKLSEKKWHILLLLAKNSMLADSADQEASKAAAGPTEDEELLMVARGEIPELDSEDELSQEAASVGSENE